MTHVRPGTVCREDAPVAVARFRYGYDDRGNRLSESFDGELAGTTGIETTAYGYDRSDRLTGVLEPSGLGRLYQLGGDGSRVGEKQFTSYAGTLGPGGYATAGGVEQRYQYDERGGLESIVEGGSPAATWTMDLAGRVLTEARGPETKAFTWDAAGRLSAATVTKPLAGGGAATETLGYRYDHAGLRVEKTSSLGTTRYVWGEDDLVEEVLPTGTSLLYERAGLLVTGIRASGGTGTRERVLHDALGSVVGRMKPDGTAVSYRYDAWGSFRGGGPTGSEPSLAYAGQHWDEDLGLSYAQQRWYEPGVGRFLSEDPVFGDVQRPSSLQVFGYANGNALQFTDPEGTQGIPQFLNAPRSIGLPTARDQCQKDITWIGCAAAIGSKVDGDYATYDQYIAEGECTPEFARGFKACDMRPVQDAWHGSDIGETTREFWTANPGRAQTMGCFIGGVYAITPVGGGDISELPESMRRSTAMCQFAVGGATLGVALIENGPAAFQKLKDARKAMSSEPALATVAADGRTAALAAEEASAARKAPTSFEATARGDRPQGKLTSSPPGEPRGPAPDELVPSLRPPRTVPGPHPFEGIPKELHPDVFDIIGDLQAARAGDARAAARLAARNQHALTGNYKGWTSLDIAGRQNPLRFLYKEGADGVKWTSPDPE